MQRTGYTKKLELQIGSMLAGRTVKTASYSEKLVKNVSDCNSLIVGKDIRGWCNLTYTIQSVNKETDTVLLKYAIPNTLHQCVNITWPISALSKSFGIRI